MTDEAHPCTPDRRYFVVRGRLWRMSNPRLSSAERQLLVNQLMAARREVRAASDDAHLLQEARIAVDLVKTRLGERGPVWWLDGAPDYNRRMAMNSPYAHWYKTLLTSDTRNSPTVDAS